jgi:hypothetical protein
MDSSSDRPLCFSSTLRECAFILTTTLASAQTLVFGGPIVCITSRIAEDLNMSTSEVTWLSVCPPSESSSTLPNLSLTSSKPFLTSFHLDISKYRNFAASAGPQTGFRLLLTILWQSSRRLRTTLSSPLWYGLLCPMSTHCYVCDVIVARRTAISCRWSFQRGHETEQHCGFRRVDSDIQWCRWIRSGWGASVV